MFLAQVVQGELEYIHMQQPASLDRRAILQTTSRPHQIYDVPISPPVARPLTSDFEVSKNIPLDEDMEAGANIRPSFRSGSHRKNRIPPSGGSLGLTQGPLATSVGRHMSADELPYAVSGLATRMPPNSRRGGREGRPIAVSGRDSEERGFVISDGHQLPEATFI
jgi:hypothetical protein